MSDDKERRGVIQEELSKLVAKDGTIRPEDVVSAAAAVAHPLHVEFEWDDSAAGHAYRLVQAQALIRYVKITVETPDHKFVAVRLFASLPSDREDGSGYRTIHSILSDEQLRAELLKAALNELESFRMKYRHLCEFASVIDAIERTKETLSRAARPAPRRTKGARKPKGRGKRGPGLRDDRPSK